jgi:antitoxin (DNA-binding transcriptional repressor) of toxin-antitoxin stability system
MATVDLSDAKARLPEIIASLPPGEQLVIVEDGEPLAVDPHVARPLALHGRQREKHPALDGARFRCSPGGVPGVSGMTSLLLDTHALLWFFWDDPQLTASANR